MENIKTVIYDKIFARVEVALCSLFTFKKMIYSICYFLFLCSMEDYFQKFFVSNSKYLNVTHTIITTIKNRLLQLLKIAINGELTTITKNYNNLYYLILF